MIDLPFLLDKCEDCGSKWSASDRDRSNCCLVCGSARVRFAKPGVLVAGAAVCAVAVAGVLLASRPHSHSSAPGSDVAGNPRVPTYQVPIATGLPGSQPSREEAKPAVRESAPEPSAGGNANSAPSEESSGITDEPPGLTCDAITSEAGRRACETPALPKTDNDPAGNDGAKPDRAQRRKLQAEQEQWRRKAQEACNGDESCMINAYRDRAEQLLDGRNSP